MEELLRLGDVDSGGANDASCGQDLQSPASCPMEDLRMQATAYRNQATHGWIQILVLLSGASTAM